MAKKTGILFQTIDFVHDASVFITICLNDFFSKYVWHQAYILYNFLIDNCWILQYWGLECVSFSPRFLSTFVCQICHGRTYSGTLMVYWLWWLDQLDFLHESRYTYYLWLGLSRNDNNISLGLLCEEELVMCTDKHCGTENKYLNIKDNNNNQFPTSNDMLLLFTPFAINHLYYFSYFVHLFHVILSAKWKIAKVWGKFCIFLHLVLLKKTVWSSCHGFKWTSCHTPSETRSNMETVDMMFEIIKRRTHTFFPTTFTPYQRCYNFWAKRWYILEDKCYPREFLT